MKKPKRITKEQYLTLAALKMPVYSHSIYLGYEELAYRLRNAAIQEAEHDHFLHYSEDCSMFHTLVEEDGQPLGEQL